MMHRQRRKQRQKQRGRDRDIGGGSGRGRGSGRSPGPRAQGEHEGDGRRVRCPLPSPCSVLRGEPFDIGGKILILGGSVKFWRKYGPCLPVGEELEGRAWVPRLPSALRRKAAGVGPGSGRGWAGGGAGGGASPTDRPGVIFM